MDQDFSTAAGEPATPARAPDEDRDLPETIPAPGEQPLDEDDGGGDFADIEVNGRFYQVHKDLKDSFLLQADYTRQTQTVAERQRNLDARAERISQQARTGADEIADRATATLAQQHLQSYAEIDWDSAFAVDPETAGMHARMVGELEHVLGETASRVNERTTTGSEAAQRELMTRIAETDRFARKEIPGWTPDLGAKLLGFAVADGASQVFLRANLSPVLMKFLHRAYIGDQALRKQKRGAPQAVTQPLATVGAKANPPVRASLRDLAKSADASAYIAARQVRIRR